MLCVTLACSRAAASQPTAPAPDPKRFEYTKLIMGVEARIVLYAESEPQARNAATAGFRRMEALDRALSDYRRNSEVKTLAAIGADGPTHVSDDLLEALRLGVQVAEISGGAFDPTVGPLTSLWREARQAGELPDAPALEDARQRTGYRQIEFGPGGTVRLARRGMGIDFGGLGKGLAAREAVEAMAGAGARSCLVDLGGDICAGAAPPGREGWMVRIDPGRGEPIDVTLASSAVATSGDTEQFIEIDGVRYSHILDPRTGLGLTTHCSVTVLARDGAMADALASAVSVLGPKEGIALIERMPEAEAMVRIGEGDKVRSVRSSGFPGDGETAIAHNRPPEGFGALFNGRDLDGWKGFAGDTPARWALSGAELAAAQREADERMRAHWSVADGVLMFDGGGESLVSARKYGDFELICDWKIGPGGDSGIYLRGVPQVQIWDNPAGSGGLYNNQKNPSQPLVVADNPVGAWNRFVIRMIGERVTVHLNGHLVVDDAPLENYWDRSRRVYERGEIELQAHGAPLWFRNIFIREIEAEQAVPSDP